MGRLFTIGDNYAGCKLKHYKEDIKGGDNFKDVDDNDPTLGNNAAVTLVNASIMVHTDAKPNTPADISEDIEVFVSKNRGFTWEKSEITKWTNQAIDSGIPAAAGNNDNTRNMAMIKITDGTHVWWRIIKGQ